MSDSVLEAYVQAVKAKWRDLSHRDEPEKARQSLIDMVEGEIARIRALAAEHEPNTGEDAVADPSASKAFENSPKAVAMRREFLKYKGSLERGMVAIRKEKRARKADGDSQGLPPVPGKDISPGDGRPASWWRESGAGETGRRTEDAGRGVEGGGRGQDGLDHDREGECGSGGLVAVGCSGAAVENGRETRADGARVCLTTSE